MAQPRMDQELAKMSKKNLAICRNQLELIQNPSPILVITLTVLTIGILYAAFLLFGAASPSGTWIAPDKTRHQITSNLLLGTILIECDKVHKSGTVRGSSLKITSEPSNLTGLWAENQIIWTEPNGNLLIWNKEKLIY